MVAETGQVQQAETRNDPLAFPRRHPDLFSTEEAVAYLHLDGPRGLETCREKFGLAGYQGPNKSLMYWREDLDACAKRIVGRDKVTAQPGKLRIAGTRG